MVLFVLRVKQEKIMEKCFDILSFGAVPDGVTENSAAIQRAIDACHESGGGRVFCGSGTFLSGSFELKSNVELHLAVGCRIVGSPRLEDYRELTAPGFRTERSPERSSQSLVRAIGAENIAITGPGELNGSGLAFYDTSLGPVTFFPKPVGARPRIVMFYKCRNIRIQETSFIDSPCWTIWLMMCERVAIHRVTVSGDQRMINNDGIDIDACRDVTVSDSFFKTADDCVILRSIQGCYETPALCENVSVANCVLDSCCQGIRVGCPGDGEIRNAVFSNIVINSASNGINFENPKRYLRDTMRGTADVHDILFSNITIDCVNTPISIVVEDGIELPRLAGIGFFHVRIRSGKPCLVKGSPETIIRDVTFSDIRLDTTGDDAVICRNCEGVKFNGVEVANRARPRP